MPLTPEEYDAIQELFAEVNSLVDEAADEVEENPRTVFREAFETPGHGIEVMGDGLRIYKEAKGTLANIPLPYDAVYGIDAGTTRPESYTNGLVMDVANAKIAMLGDGNEAVERKSTIVGAGYHKDEAFDFGDRTVRSGDITTKLVGVEGNGRREARDRVSTIARTLAEGTHAEKLAHQLDGPLFRDGSIYPMSVLPTLLYAKAKAQQDASNLQFLYASGKHREQDIVDAYVHTIDTMVDNGYPVMGVVKTMSSDALVSTLEAKLTAAQNDEVTLQWSRDDQFLSDALYVDDPDAVTFTSWLVKTKAEADGQEVEPLLGFDHADHRDPEDYRRAFFYVRLPTTETVFRIEAPLMWVRDPDDREELQHMALKLLVEAGKPPEVIRRADDLAHISQDNSKDLKRKLLAQMQQVTDYNRHGRFEDIRYADDDHNHNGGNYE